MPSHKKTAKYASLLTWNTIQYLEIMTDLIITTTTKKSKPQKVRYETFYVNKNIHTGFCRVLSIYIISAQKNSLKGHTTHAQRIALEGRVHREGEGVGMRMAVKSHF